MQRQTGARKDGTKVSEMQRVDEYPVASVFINQMMATVMDCVRNSPVLKRKLFQANFQDSLSGEAMVSLIDNFAEQASRLCPMRLSALIRYKNLKMLEALLGECSAQKCNLLRIFQNSCHAIEKSTKPKAGLCPEITIP